MKISLLFILITTFVGYVFAAFSGVYVDNGEGQTVMQEGISRQEKLQFERDMLDLLGLPSKPRKASNISDLSTSAPKFLYELYKSLDGLKMEDDFNLKKEDLRSIKESDSIMTFLSKNDRVNAVRHEKGKRLWFDVSDAPVGDTLVGAEVRLYRNVDEDIDQQPLTITMYHVIEELSGRKELILTDSVNVTSNYKGWLVFNVTSAFVSWVAFPTSNRGLYISVQKQAEPNSEMHPEEAGIISVVYEGEENQPFVVAYFKYNNNRSRRRTREAPVAKHRSRKSNADVSYNTNPFTDSAWTSRTCQIQTLYVNFKDLDWHEWIVAPDGYASYYCSGICDFPLNAHMNATNHAIVQTLVHLIDPNQAPKPFCAPSKLGSMSVLYYLEDNSVTLKKFRNMIVKSCGCH